MIRWRRRDPDARPIGVEFIRDERRQTGISALAEFAVLDDDGDAIVSVDVQKGVGLEQRLLSGARAEADDADGQRRACGPIRLAGIDAGRA